MENKKGNQCIVENWLAMSMSTAHDSSLYAPQVECLSELLGKDIAHWSKD